MSYLDFFCANIYTQNSESIHGTCYNMCPEDEVAMREREKLVHVLEVLGPTRKLVKAYSRSAADSNMAVPHLLRPYSVLKDTVQYLILEVTKRRDTSTAMVYDFVNDRLRAVRQDMTIQRLPPEQCVVLLEPMVRFYVYYGHKLCELPIKDYDPTLNKKYLIECLKWFLSCSDALGCRKGENIEELTGFLSGLKINNKYKLQCDRGLMESLYILCNLDDVHPLYRYLDLQKNLKSDPRLQLAYTIAIANLKGNYILACKLLDRLCPLTYCAFCLYLPVLQRRAIAVMSRAYSSARLSVPCEAVRAWLRLPRDADAAVACAHYGLRADNNTVRFLKGDYNAEVNTLQPKKLLSLEDKMNLSIDHIFTYA